MRNLSFIFSIILALHGVPSFAQDDFAVPPAPHMEDYFVPGLAPVRADQGADLTIIYFIDYQCPACRTHTPGVSAVFASDHKLKVIYRDTPMFGPLSVEAARYAIASQFQDKHDAFHRALMAQKLPLDAAAVRAAAAKAGIDWARLEKDRAAHAKAIDAQIAQNQNLSEAAGISGTPAFIIGNTLANGALDAKGLRAEISNARAADLKAPSTKLPKAQGPEPMPSGEASSSNKVADVTANVVVATSPTPTAAPTFAPAKSPPAAQMESSASWTVPALIASMAAGLAGLLLLVRRRARRRQPR